MHPPNSLFCSLLPLYCSFCFCDLFTSLYTLSSYESLSQKVTSLEQSLQEAIFASVKSALDSIHNSIPYISSKIMPPQTPSASNPNPSLCPPAPLPSPATTRPQIPPTDFSFQTPPPPIPDPQILTPKPTQCTTFKSICQHAVHLESSLYLFHLFYQHQFLPNQAFSPFPHHCSTPSFINSYVYSHLP